jgi:hypothetical protein
VVYQVRHGIQPPSGYGVPSALSRAGGVALHDVIPQGSSWAGASRPLLDPLPDRSAGETPAVPAIYTWPINEIGACVLHFAYGSNMCVPMMRRRCPTARLAGCAVLPGHRFIITQDGFASIMSDPGACVHGLLWRLAPRDLAALNAYEHLDSGLYRAATMTVVANRRGLAALVYIGRTVVRGEPRPGYMDINAEAARNAGFPPHYVLTLARLRRPTIMPRPRAFATGSAGVPPALPSSASREEGRARRPLFPRQHLK